MSWKSWSVVQATSYLLPALPVLAQRVRPGYLCVHPLLGVVCLLLLPAERGVPGLEGRPGLGRRVGYVDRVYLVPHRGVQQGPERVARAQLLGRQRVGDAGLGYEGVYRQAVGDGSVSVCRRRVDYRVPCRRGGVCGVGRGDCRAEAQASREGESQHRCREQYAGHQFHNLQR